MWRVKYFLLRRKDITTYDTKRTYMKVGRLGVWYIRSLFVLFAILLILVMQVFLFSNITPARTYEVGSAKRWLEAFTNHNYKLCDEMVETDRDKISNPEASSLGSNKVSNEIYSAFIDATADSITEIIAVEQKQGKSHIKVKIRPYIKIVKIDLDLDGLKQLVAKYLDGEITQKQFKKELNNIYLDTFHKSVLQCNSEGVEEQVLEYDLVEKNTEKLQGIYDFVYDIAEKDNLMQNLEVFENQIDEQVNELMLEVETEEQQNQVGIEDD